MSILIKGMEMPKNGEITIIALASVENGKNAIAVILDSNGTPIKHKEIVEVPTPHGRLIDAERLFNIFEPITSFPEDEQIMYVEAFLTAIKQAQTIIEAEVSE